MSFIPSKLVSSHIQLASIESQVIYHTDFYQPDNKSTLMHDIFL